LQGFFENFIFTWRKEALEGREDSSSLQNALCNKLLQPQAWSYRRFLYLPLEKEPTTLNPLSQKYETGNLNIQTYSSSLQ